MLVREKLGLTGEGTGGWGRWWGEGFLGHGRDDVYVDVELGEGAARVLEGMGYEVVWKTYEGAEEEGYWNKEPEEVEDMI